MRNKQNPTKKKSLFRFDSVSFEIPIHRSVIEDTHSQIDIPNVKWDCLNGFVKYVRVANCMDSTKLLSWKHTCSVWVEGKETSKKTKQQQQQQRHTNIYFPVFPINHCQQWPYQIHSNKRILAPNKYLATMGITLVLFTLSLSSCSTVQYDQYKLVRIR